MTPEPQTTEQMVEVNQLSYAHPGTDSRLTWDPLLKAAFLCWLVPLALGSLVLALFLVTRNDRFFVGGLLVLAGGFVLFVTGVVLLTLSGRQIHLRNPESRPFLIRRIRWILVLLISNWLVAFGVLAAVPLLG